MKKVRHGALTKWRNRACAVIASALLAMLPFSAYAGLLQYKFKSTTGEVKTLSKNPELTSLNPADTVNVVLSGGLDRKVRLIAKNSASGEVVATITSDLLDADSTIKLDNNTFYGAEVTLPKMGNGTYEFESQILASNGALIASEKDLALIDTVPPTVGKWSWQMNYGGGKAPDGNPIFSTTQAFHITLDHVDDKLSGIKDVTFETYYESGEDKGKLYRSGKVNYFSDTKIARRGTGAIDSVGADTYPSNFQGANRIRYVVYDNAGNKASSDLFFYNNSACGAVPKFVGVKDTSYTGTPNSISALKGYRPALDGEVTIKENPGVFLFSIPKTGWRANPDGAIFGGLPEGYSNYNAVYTDDKDVYFAVSSTVTIDGTLNYPTYGWTNYSTWRCGGMDLPKPIFSDETLPPEWKDIKGYIEGFGWIPKEFGAPGTTPIPHRNSTITKFAVVAEPRSYSQIATVDGFGSCTILPGKTSCEADVSVAFATEGTASHHHTRPALQKQDSNMLVRTPTSIPNGLVWEWDADDPSVLDVISNTISTKTVVYKVEERFTGETWGNKKLKDTGLVAKSSGISKKIPSTFVATEGNISTVTASYADLPDGSVSIYAWARDNYLNMSKEKLLFSFDNDSTPPVISYSIANSAKVSSLDEIVTSVNDSKDAAPSIVSMTLSEGPTKRNIGLSWRSAGKGKWALEYPVIFPSQNKSEMYTLTTVAKDNQGNTTTKSIRFMFEPPLIYPKKTEKGKIDFPANSYPFVHNDGSEVIESDPLRMGDGSYVTGVYDVNASLRSDAPGPVVVNGVVISPGDTAKVLSQLNFTTTGSKISVSARPLNSYQTGRAQIILSTAAPNSPYVLADLNLWIPEVNAVGNHPAPYQAITDSVIKLVAAPTTACSLTTSQDIAKAADPITSPTCLVEFTNIPRGLSLADDPDSKNGMLKLVGRFLDAGPQKISYAISIYNRSTTKVFLDNGASLFVVEKPSATFGMSATDKKIVRATESVVSTVKQLTGPSCTPTTNEYNAKAAAVAMGPPVCLIELTTSPSDLALKSETPPTLAGAFTRAGQHAVAWTASIYDSTGVKLILEKGASSFEVVEPPVTTNLKLSVNESSSVNATPVEDFPAAWEKKTYSVLSSPAYGSVVATPTGFTYTPNTGYVGPDEFRYRVQDVSGMKAEATAVVNVAKFNYAPTWTGVTIQASEGQVSDQIAPEVHDINLWDSHTFKILTNPTHGTVRVFYGRMEYTPNPGFYGKDSFTFSATDQEGLSVKGEGKVTVIQFNFAPTGITPSTVKMYEGIGGTADLKVIDPNNWGSHTLQVVKQPAHGHVTVEGMSITYKTDGQAETSVQIRAIDQDGLYVDQDVVLKLLPAWEMFKDREVQPTSVAPSIPAVKHQMTTRLGAYALRIPDQKVIQALGGEIIAIVTPDSKVGVTLEHRELSQGTGMRLVPTKKTADLLEARLGGLDVGVDGQALVYLSRADMTGPVYSIPVTVWAPEGVLTADAWEILQASGRAQISFSPSNGACSILTSEVVAKPKNALQDRACYVSWTKTPDEWRDASTLANLVMDAGGSSLGNQTIEATAYVFDSSGVKHKIASFNRDLKILPVADQIRFDLKPAPADAYQKVQELSLLLRHTSGPVCDATANEGVAKKTAQQWSSRPSCLIRWMQMPEGMAQQRNTVTPLAEGTMTLLGANNISWKASIFTPSGQEIDIGYGEHSVNVIEPPAIAIDMPASTLVKDGVYSVSQLGGYVGSASVTAIAASLDLAINRADVVIERSTIPSYGRPQRFTRYIEGAEAPLWSVTPYSVDVGYTALPNMRSTKTASLLAVPHDKILPVILNDERTVLDTVSLPIRVAIKDTRYMEDAYRLSSMGDWDIRLLSTTAGVNYEPMTNWEPIDENGEVEFVVDLQSLTNKAVRIIAEARVRSPVPEYELIRESSSPMVLSVLNGEALDGSIQALRVIGPAPLRSSFYAVTNDRYQSGDIGEVRWEMSKDGGVSWEGVEANAKLPQRLSMIFQRGTYLLRAELTNRHSGAKSMTPTVEVIAYVVPVARLKGPANVFIGDSGTFTLTDLKGNALDTTGMVVEWSEDRGKTWAAGEGSYRLSRNSADRVYLTARLKYSDSPEDKRVYKTLRAGVAFRPVRPPRVQIIGPRRPEVGKEATWVANLMMPYPKMDMTMDGEFILPDGTVVDSTEVKYTPTREDMEKEESYISVRSWINGYEDRGGLGLTQHRLIFWSYDWPEWKINTKYSAKYAPADLTMTARSLGLFREFEGLTIEWDIPPYAGLEMIKDSSQTSRIVRLTEPGIYTFGAHITDSRGNYSYAETEMEFLEPIPWDVKLSWSGDNDANRAPLGVLIRPSITGGHPKDQILSKTFSLNGETLSSSGDYGRATLEEEGVYTVKLDVASAMGHTATGQVDISVARNKPPVCKLELVVGRTSWLAKAVCTDEDGRMAKNLWFINGEQQALSSNSISVPMWRYPDGEPVITLVGIDNSGAESPPVSNK